VKWGDAVIAALNALNGINPVTPAIVRTITWTPPAPFGQCDALCAGFMRACSPSCEHLRNVGRKDTPSVGSTVNFAAPLHKVEREPARRGAEIFSLPRDFPLQIVAQSVGVDGQQK